MVNKCTDEDKLYRVVRKNGSHLNTKVNPDGSKSALQFTDDGNGLSGLVDLIEVNKAELIKTEYVQVPQKEHSQTDQFLEECIYPAVRDLISQVTASLLEYAYAKTASLLKEKVFPIAKSKAKAGLQDLKLFISAPKGSDKPIKASQSIAKKQKSSMTRGIKASNKVNNQEENKYVLSQEEFDILLDKAQEKTLVLATILKILNNSVIDDDGTDPKRIADIQGKIIKLKSKDNTTLIGLVLKDKNSELDEETITMLKAFRDGMFIGNGTPIPISRYIEADKQIKE